MDTGSKDLISSLPDVVLAIILSNLSTKEAASTSVLAKRWRYLLALVPNLDFDTSIFNYSVCGRPRRKLMRRNFKVFVDRVMALQGNARLNKFSLKCKVCGDSAPVNSWISTALERGVLDLDLQICSKPPPGCRESYTPSRGLEFAYRLPSNVLMSKTLVKLKLGGMMIDVGVGDVVFLPKLKTLHLHDGAMFKAMGAEFSKLISSCPELEELVLVRQMWWDDLSLSCCVSNPNLKRLKIYCETDHAHEIPKSVSFDTPNLLYFEFTDYVALKYPKVHFDSLVEARLDLQMSPNERSYASDEEEEDMIEHPADLLMGISNVKILYLSSYTLEGLHYSNTRQCSDERYRFKDTRKCSHEYGGRCVCKPWEGTPIGLSSTPVKTLKVFKFAENKDKQMDLIEHFLETMPNLEQVMLYYDSPVDADLSLVSTRLQKLEKVASPKCKIQVISDNISFSSTLGSTSGLFFFNNTFPV